MAGDAIGLGVWMRAAVAIRRLIEYVAPRRIEDPAFNSLWFNRRRGLWSKKELIGRDAPILLVHAGEHGPSERQRRLRIELEGRFADVCASVDAPLREWYTGVYGDGRSQPADIRAIAKLRRVEFPRDGDEQAAELHLLYEMISDDEGRMLRVLLKDWKSCGVQSAT